MPSEHAYFNDQLPLEQGIHYLLIENVRCFYGQTAIPIRPMTLLVGENSSGKSTCMALYRIAWQAIYGRGRPDFNEDPFLLGAFEEIVSKRMGPLGRITEFSLGMAIPRSASGMLIEDAHADHVQIAFTFISSDGGPSPRKWQISCGEYSISAEQEWGDEEDDAQDGGSGVRIRLSAPKTQYSTLMMLAPFPDQGIPSWTWMAEGLRFGLLSRSETRRPRHPRATLFADLVLDPEHAAFLRQMIDTIQAFGRLSGVPRAIAPIRSKPKRSYDPITESPESEGGHVPLYLAKALSQSSSRKASPSASIDAFGQASGLYKHIDVKRHGASESSPFQLRVKIGKEAFNLIDVGYGVSQVLPILVDLHAGSGTQTILLQQPEVHLHPRAQAELATHMGRAASGSGRRLVIETHSDYFISRLRTDVRDRKVDLEPQDVGILFFERQARGTSLHHIRMDSDGNLLGAPTTYRQFFIDEEIKNISGGA